MVFYSRSNLQNKQYPHIILAKVHWNDYFKYETMYNLTYYSEYGSSRYIGQVKILDKRTDNTKIPETFQELDDNYCSLGVDINYYTEIKTFIPDYESLLENLNDVAFLPTVAEEFETLPGFINSLLRYSESEKAYKQGKRLIQGIDYKEPFEFQYDCILDNADDSHSVKFNFNISEQLPHRIITLIGRNGTGKTQYLSNLALDLSGQKRSIGNIGKFEPRRPLFSKIITVSYSVFDKFARPQKQKSFSYKYCGLRDDKGIISQNKLNEIYEQSIKLIKDHNRQIVWYNSLQNIIPEHILNMLYEDFFEKDSVEDFAKKGKQNLSSGQSIFMFILTEIIANIRDESLILFDEPEMHLHPNAIANLLKTFQIILERFDSYAIMATHSPIILQDVPSKFVRIFEREGNVPIVRDLQVECFGNSITTITQSVFETIEVRESFKDFFATKSKELNMENIENIFEGNLSLNARLFLKNCYNSNEKIK
jgi:ABC-type lipoprotein export system ATPase subunit